jgi:hypothetical protein
MKPQIPQIEKEAHAKARRGQGAKEEKKDLSSLPLRLRFL